MSQLLTRITLEPPYLLFLGEVTEAGYAKTALGIADWRPERCAGQMSLPGCKVATGLREMNVQEAVGAGVRTAIIGVAPVGGRLPPAWIAPLSALARAGIDVAAGLHSKLRDIPELVAAAAEGRAKLIDVRDPPPNLPCGTGRKRRGLRVLTVGTDCALGKKYTALALHRELSTRGVKATFRATGQTGIMIAGEGIPIDAVVADFVAGAAEVLSPENDADHWDVIEGQGSLFHPAYASVTLGLLHGSQPDAFVVCHEATREYVQGWEGEYRLPSIPALIERTILLGQMTNPKIRCVGISLNTSRLPERERASACQRLSDELGLPCSDPVAMGMRGIADRLLENR
ncbi:MAG TPA: DUF1611 domain-containing protein [Nevskiaceae bacterium]|nr:DUF1611 domain-containing protein [Nevskiaceae bacterium]